MERKFKATKNFHMHDLNDRLWHIEKAQEVSTYKVIDESTFLNLKLNHDNIIRITESDLVSLVNQNLLEEYGK